MTGDFTITEDNGIYVPGTASNDDKLMVDADLLTILNKSTGTQYCDSKWISIDAYVPYEMDE